MFLFVYILLEFHKELNLFTV